MRIHKVGNPSSRNLFRRLFAVAPPGQCHATGAAKQLDDTGPTPGIIGPRYRISSLYGEGTALHWNSYSRRVYLADLVGDIASGSAIEYLGPVQD